jgi:3-methyl-2-oxobutanoate hydroxymethyltransferase
MKDMSVKNLQYPQDWIERKKQKELISVVTCYDFLVAKWISKTDIDAILVGDSLGMVVQGNNSTLPVKLEDIIYHAKIVRRGAPNKFLIADMPYGSYQSDLSEGLRNSFRVIKETNCQALKFEGADDSTLKVIDSLVKSGFPVMGHIGLTPQSFMMMGGFRIQGKEEKQKQILLEQAKKLEDVGCFAIVLELVEKELAKRNLFKTYYTYHRYWFGKSNRWPSTCDLRFIRNGPRFYPKTCKKIY